MTSTEIFAHIQRDQEAVNILNEMITAGEYTYTTRFDMKETLKKIKAGLN